MCVCVCVCVCILYVQWCICRAAQSPRHSLYYTGARLARTAHLRRRTRFDARVFAPARAARACQRRAQGRAHLCGSLRQGGRAYPRARTPAW